MISNSAKAFIGRLETVGKRAQDLNLNTRFAELRDLYEVSGRIAGKTSMTDLEPSFEERLKWWESILLSRPGIDRDFNAEKWLAKLDRALDRRPYRFLKHSGKERHDADLIMDNIFQFINYKPVYAGSLIDWNDNPFGDHEWTTCMNRHSFLLSLEKQYCLTGDKSYADKSKDLFLDWACSQPVREWNIGRYGWSTLNAGIRGIVWPKVFCMWSKAGLLTGAFKTAAVNILIKNAEFLMGFKHAGPSNWRIFEAEGLFNMAMILPGLKQAVHWRNESVKRMKLEMARQIRADGCHFQNCPGYHQGMLRTFYSISLLGKRLELNGFFSNKSFLNTLETMCEFSMYTSDPEFMTLPIGDSGRNDITEFFAESEELFDRDDFKYVLSKREKGVPPRKTSCVLKPSGHVIFRSDWSRQARFMFFDLAEHMGCHSHYDVFNVHIWAYGRELISDSGRTTYRQEDKQMMEASSRHNTVTVDGKNQNRSLPVLRKFKTRGNWAFVQAESHNYNSVRHVRSIIFIDGKHWLIIDSLYASGSHDYALSFHTLQKKAFLDGRKLIMPNMIIACRCDTPVKTVLEPADFGRDYNEVTRGKVLRFTGKAQNIRFATLLSTYENRQDPPSCLLKLDTDGAIIKAEARIGNENYKADYSENDACVNVSFPAGTVNF